MVHWDREKYVGLTRALAYLTKFQVPAEVGEYLKHIEEYLGFNGVKYLSWFKVMSLQL